MSKPTKKKPEIKEGKFKKRFLGPSSDRRTNRWELTCTCGNVWVPITTRFALSFEQCQKCGKEQAVNYNEDQP